MWRIQEYVTLLQALTSHTRPGHPDHPDLRSALNAMLQFRDFIQEVTELGFTQRLLQVPAKYGNDLCVFQLERNSEADRRLEETQELIRDCPVRGLSFVLLKNILKSHLNYCFLLYIHAQSLAEGNRQLIITQDAMLLRSPDEQIPDSLR